MYVFDTGCVLLLNMCVFLLALLLPLCFVKRRMLPFGHLFFPVFYLVLYLPPMFVGVHHFVRCPFEVYLVLVPYLCGTFFIWCSSRSPMRVVFSFPLFLTYAAGMCTLHATHVGRIRLAGLQLVKSFLYLRAF